ncbi:hypothetical protein ACHAWF_004730, partial [Thalassiosira exigua]
MGSQSRPNRGTTMAVILRVLELITEDAESEEDAEIARELWKVGAFICLSTAASLRENEGYMVDLAALRGNVDKGRVGSVPREVTKDTIFTEEECLALPHVAICLLGKVKGETRVDQHVLNVANHTRSGLKPRFWVEKLIQVAAEEGRASGPAFASAGGELADSRSYDERFLLYMERVQAEDKGLIDKDEKLREWYSLFRTPRKTAQTRIVRAGFGDSFQKAFSRWAQVEKAGTRRVKRGMPEHYAEATLLMPVTW